jgi:hypothetical protein
VRQDEVAAGGECVADDGHEPGRVLGIGHEQDGQEQDEDGLAEVEQPGDLGIGEQARRECAATTGSLSA